MTYPQGSTVRLAIARAVHCHLRCFPEKGDALMLPILRSILALAMVCSLGCDDAGPNPSDGRDAAFNDAGAVGTEDVLPPEPNAEVGPDRGGDDGTADLPDAEIVQPDSAAPRLDVPGERADGSLEPRDAAADRWDAADAATCSGICNAATPSYPTVDATSGNGNVTMYTTEPSSGGACNYGTTKIAYFAAINVNMQPGDDRGQWQAGRACGQCVEVTTRTSQGSRSVVVRIMDRCADVYCGVDLGGDAPAVVMPDGFGRYDGSWRFVSCAGHPETSDGPPSLYVVANSNPWWSRIQIRNPPWAVESIAWHDPASGASGSIPYANDPENTFAVPSEVLGSTASALVVTVQYRDGTTATAELSPSELAAGGASYPLQ
jgi:hypothetical protein